MQIRSRGIVIHSLKYGETSLIVRIFTREAGLQSFLVKGVRSQKGAIRPSHLMPLNLLEMEFSIRQNKQLQTLKEIKCDPVLFELHHHPAKRSIALFVTELLNRSLREEGKNEELFDFIDGTLQILDLQRDGLSLFPHYFSLKLTRYLGFVPDSDFEEGRCLDLLEGCYLPVAKAGPHFMNEVNSSLSNRLLKNTFDECATWSVRPEVRRALLEDILRYYRLHLDHFKDLQSHDILREVLSA
ncbi:MAG: DNA repair protein RecO [Bacteroidetes bacterium]|nr:DNA repair protein RecO [Bacteroidota bacterium]